MAVPTGLIAMWSGTLATIPANWNLCDGSGVTPNLIARFLRGAPAATDPGTTGGADSHNHTMGSAGSHGHTLSSAGHGHTTSSDGTHDHTRVREVSSGSNALMSAIVGAHSHTVNTAYHSHSLSSSGTAHTHTISTDDGRPPYYEVAFIQAAAGANIAAGIIIIWTGTLATIPAGWALCDGGGTTPDLRQRFLRGVNTGATDPGTTGGATTHGHTEGSDSHSHTISTDAPGSHTFNAYTWTHSHNANTSSSGSYAFVQSDSGGGNHTHSSTDNPGSHDHGTTSGSGGSHAHSVVAASSLPAYYAVAYIISTGATTVPANGILIWTGTLATIPGSYTLCDGGDGRPELRSRFLYGTAAGVDPGGTGGADSHLHTDTSTGTSHSDHSHGSDGSHTHAATNTTGSHTHSTGGIGTYTVSIYIAYNASDGAHSHTFSSGGSHTHSVTAAGSHTHTWNPADTRPAYYEVAYVIFAGGGGGVEDKSASVAAKMVAGGLI